MSNIVLECKNVSHWFGKKRVLYDVNLRIVRGEIVGLVGSSGCGKSTLLRAMLGTHPAASGAVLMNGEPILAPGRRRGIVYQRYSLFPFMTAVQNVAFGLTLDKFGVFGRVYRYFEWRRVRKEHLEKAAQLLQKFKLGPDSWNLYPSEMSGGMCQRVAIAQALIMKPEILLLDEPFGALDEATREEQQEMLGDLYKENLHARRDGKEPPYTIILVTHELNEAIGVSDRVVALSNFWAWEKEGHTSHPGSTVVYDASTPPFPRDPNSKTEVFRLQRAEIREAAFEPSQRHERGKYLRFWQECADGKGVGIMQKELNESPTFIVTGKRGPAADVKH